MGLKGRAIVLGFSLCFCACKTTDKKGVESNLNAWANAQDKELARKQFTQTIRDCVPLVTAVVPGAKTLRIGSDNETSAVVDKFVDEMVQDPDPKVEQSAALLRYFYGDKGRSLPACGGQAAEYVLTEFAARTNALSVAFGEEPKLRLIDP